MSIQTILQIFIPAFIGYLVSYNLQKKEYKNKQRWAYYFTIFFIVIMGGVVIGNAVYFLYFVRW